MQKSDTEKKLAASLTANDTALIPYLPYLLQDIYELGTGTEDMCDLLNQYVNPLPQQKVIDFGCGKGAVCIRIAKEFGCIVKGIDIMPAFIEYAKHSAEKLGLNRLCSFKTEDINLSVLSETGYDIAILGAVGDILGYPEETLSKLKMTVKPGGYILIDDAYGDNTPDVYSHAQWIDAFHNTGLQLVTEKVSDIEQLKKMNAFNQQVLTKRAHELMESHPLQAHMFEQYIADQQSECDLFEKENTCVTWLLQK